MFSLINVIQCFPRPCRLRRKRGTSANQLLVSQPLADDARHAFQKAPQVAEIVLPLVEPKRLLVQIPEQMKGLHRNVRPANGALEQAPEILDALVWTFPRA